MNCNFISMNLIPINYNLTFESDLEKFTFKGREILTFELKPHSTKASRGEAKQIVLDAVDLKIHSVILASGAHPESNNDSGVIANAPPQNDNKVSFRIDQKNEKLIIQLAKELEVGRYKLYLEFEGILNDKLTGFYRCKYYTPEVFSSSSFTSGVKKKPKEKYLATTQFEAADARRAFPCIDHPSSKATFDVSLIIDKDLTAVSNTLPKKTVILNTFDKLSVNSVKDLANEVSVNIKKDASLDSSVASLPQNDKAEKKLIKFETTPLMSTYLLYLGVGEFEFLQDSYTSEVNLQKFHPRGITKGYSKLNLGGVATSDVKLRVVTTPGKSQYGKFALECAKKCLEYFEKYFDYPYPLKKLDLLAIPEFATGAMENWGAITFRENALLFYPEKSSKATLQRIASIIAHEIAHQWFGNLVTMKWWDDLWLNESFATYIAYKVIDHYWPEWDVWSQYITDTVFEGMGLDSLKSSHPIKVTVKNTAELDELFDEIAYEKGGSILRMLDLYLGEKVFRDGLRSYIKKYQYKNASAPNLWNELENASDKPVADLMQKYITQVGFPLVSVKKKNNHLELSQRRFLFENDSEKRFNWNIPILIQHSSNKRFRLLLKKQADIVKLPFKTGFININVNYSGFFISDYSFDLRNKLAENVSHLNHSDKLGLIHDLFLLILSGKKDLKELYQCLETFFTEEKSLIVLHYIISKLTGIYRLNKSQESKKITVQYSKKVLEKIVGYEPEKEENIFATYLRVAALSSLTLFDDRDVSRFVNSQFIGYLKNEKSLHPDLRAVVYSAAVWFDERNYAVLKKDYEKSQIQEEKVKLLSSLAFSKNKIQIKDFLSYSMTGKVPLSLFPYAVSSLARNPVAKESVLDWLMQSWSELEKRAGGLANMLLRRVLQAVIPICAIGREKETEAFLRKNKAVGLERTVEQVLEELRINSRFVRKYKF